MKLEDQLCSLELSKRLKELGVKQDADCSLKVKITTAPSCLFAKYPVIIIG
jgi:hypothetical protein